MDGTVATWGAWGAWACRRLPYDLRDYLQVRTGTLADGGSTVP